MLQSMVSRHNLLRGVNVHYVLQNMVSEIFSLGEFHNLPNFLPPMCCSCNEFAKFSCCQSFPPHSTCLGCLQDIIRINNLSTLKSLGIIGGGKGGAMWL